MFKFKFIFAMLNYKIKFEGKKYESSRKSKFDRKT